MSTTSQHSPPDKLRRDALQIWQAAVTAVDSRRLVRAAVRVAGQELHIGETVFDLPRIRRILVVGAGKAGAGMAAGLESALGAQILVSKQVTGWINVPADCVVPLQSIHLHAAREPGQNEPTTDGAAGAAEILRLVESAGPQDLCVALISGGASALLPAPAEGITLADKLAVTRHLSSAGADIRQLNTVRKQLSQIKGGGLWRACRAGEIVTLIISDVISDPLDVIGSGPTVLDSSTPADALQVLERFSAREAGISSAVFDYLRARDAAGIAAPTARGTNLVIGNNATACDAAIRTAAQLGYEVENIPAAPQEGLAEEVGRKLAERVPQMTQPIGPSCLVSGGEPVVKLVAAGERGVGGRNQQLVLAAAEVLAASKTPAFALLSGGTDGEDGPTDAAGAIIDEQILSEATRRGLAAADFLHRNDAYHFFEPLGALIKTGPTHTNVCDVRVVVTGGASST